MSKTRDLTFLKLYVVEGNLYNFVAVGHICVNRPLGKTRLSLGGKKRDGWVSSRVLERSAARSR